MGKKKKINYRAEQARRKNAEKAEQKRRAAERKALWDKHGKQIIIIAVALTIVSGAEYIVKNIDCISDM